GGRLAAGSTTAPRVRPRRRAPGSCRHRAVVLRLVACLLARSRSNAAGVGRPVRDVRRAALGEAGPQVGQDLAQQVALLEHGLERQPGVVEQERLTLVVAGGLAEAEGPLGDLLRRADRERRLRGEVLERRTVAVDRGVVEVGPEL